MKSRSDDEPVSSWSDLSAEEQQEFYDLANVFMGIANTQLDDSESGYVSAAFLYGCARYNAFAMQASGAPSGEMHPETKAYLVTCYTNELRGNLGQELVREGGPRYIGQATCDLLDQLASWSEEDLWTFRDVADLFVNAANDLTAKAQASRISAAFMHACARFNMFELQASGIQPHLVDEDLLARYAAGYEALIVSHMQEQLVAPRS